MQYFTGRKKILCEILIFSPNVMVFKTNFHLRFIVISKKKGHHLKSLPGNALFVLKMQWSLKKKLSLESFLSNALFDLKSSDPQKKGFPSQLFLNFYRLCPEIVAFFKKKGLYLRSASNFSNFIPNQYHFPLN